MKRRMIRLAGLIATALGVLVGCNPALQGQASTSRLPMQTAVPVSTGTAAASPSPTAPAVTSATPTSVGSSTPTLPFTATVTLPASSTTTPVVASPTASITATVLVEQAPSPMPAREFGTPSDTVAKPIPGQPLAGLERLRSLSYPLYALVQAQANGEIEQFITQLDIDVNLTSQSVRVIVNTNPGQEDAATAAVVAVGGSVLSRGTERIHGWVSISSLPQLAIDPSVFRIEKANSPRPAVAGENTWLINSNVWNTGGYNGQGKKIAVFDSSWAGYATIAQPVSFACFETPTGGIATTHGSQAVDVVRQVAPAATIFPVSAKSWVDVENKLSCLLQQGVTIATSSVFFDANYDGPGDGVGRSSSTGQLISSSNNTIDRYANSGIFFVQAAGNYAKLHWRGAWGPYVYSDGQEFLNWGNNSDTNAFSKQLFGGSGTYKIIARWSDDWTRAENDFQILLYRQDGTIAAQGRDLIQDGLPGHIPYEELEFTPPDAGYNWYYIRIKRRIDGLHQTYNSSWYPTFDVLVFPPGESLLPWDQDNTVALGRAVPTNSLPTPADNANAGMVTVGAVGTGSPNTVKNYSSRGPTTDTSRFGFGRSPRIKPDIVAPTDVCTRFAQLNCVAGPDFTGTSAAAPHVAGAAALVQEKTGFGPVDLKRFLAGDPTTGKAGRAVPVQSFTGEAGPNVNAGWGRLDLASPLDDGPMLIRPVRVVDTLDSHCSSFTEAQQTLQFYVDNRSCLSYLGQTTVLPSDMVDVMTNVTIEQNAPSGGFITVFPAGTTRPGTSTVNPATARAHNFTTVPVPAPNVGGAGQIAIFSEAPRRVIVDVLGYSRKGINSGTGHMRFLPSPVRVVDTRRTATGLAIGYNPDGSPVPVAPISANSTRRFKLAGSTFTWGIPTNATGVLAHVTTVLPAGSTGLGGFLTLFGGHIADADRPATSNVNPSTSLAFNTSVVALKPCSPGPSCALNDETVAVYSTNTIDVVIDVVGYYAPGNSAPKGGIVSIAPVRVVDTRPNGSGITTTGFLADGTNISGNPAPIVGGTSKRFLIAGRTFSGTTFPSDLTGIIANVTSVSASPGGGFLAAFPGNLSAAPTNYSTLNPVTSIAVNLWGNGIAPGMTGNNGTQGIYSTGTSDVVIDVVGYYR